MLVNNGSINIGKVYLKFTIVNHLWHKINTRPKNKAD